MMALTSIYRATLVSLKEASSSGRRYRCWLRGPESYEPGEWIEPKTTRLAEFAVVALTTDCWEIDEQRIMITRSALSEAFRKVDGEWDISRRVRQTSDEKLRGIPDLLPMLFTKIAEELGL